MSSIFGWAGRFLIFAALAIGLTGCSDPPSFRYKMTFEVETPDGVKSAYNVVEISHSSVRVPASGTKTYARGEALYLDLGPGRRPLIALLGAHRDPVTGTKSTKWGENSPFDVLARMYGENFKDYGDGNTNIVKLASYRGEREIAAERINLPDLVTFADVNDPKSVMLVDPANLEATLGPGIKWKRVTLGITDEALTTGIATKLPWLAALGGGGLDGRLSNDTYPIVERLTGSDFVRGGY